MRISVLIALLAVLSGVGPVRAQSLADLAKKEEERRKTVKGTGKVYTNQDLKPVAEPPSDTSGAGAVPGPDPGSVQGPTPGSVPGPDAGSTTPGDATSPDAPSLDAGAAAASDDDQQAASDEKKGAEPRGQAYRANRMQALREQLDRNTTYVEALESRMNALDTDFVNRDDPAQRVKIAADRDKARAELDRLRKEVAAGTKAIAATEEEARRAGVPPGWLR